MTADADAAVAALAERGSPSHDGLGARFISHELGDDGRLTINLQPSRWSLRLNASDAANSVAALCAVRDCEGRWLAGRRAEWVASWPGRWALGAGGAVDFGESPVETLARELEEEWSVSAAELRGEALVMLPNAMVMFVGQAWLAEGAAVTPDDEHDEHAWWPAQIEDWPEEADEPLRRMATLLSQAPR
jgi:8-oxo-dGTP pyrophosphatase MutT (NUDIX family)